MALRGRRINNFVELWCLAASRGLDIWVLSITFQKSNIDWPQQPPTEKVQKSVKERFLMIHSTKMEQYWSFRCQGWSNHQNQEVLWWNRAVEVGEASEVAEVNEAAVVLRPEKSLLRTSESSRFLNFISFWCFETKIFLIRSCWILAPFLSEALGASWCYFFEN